jgi:adenylylsulfate kinase
MADSKKRSLVKSVSWYFSDMAMTVVVAFAVTRDVKTSISIGLLQQTWEVVLYYFHERVWSNIRIPKKVE